MKFSLLDINKSRAFAYGCLSVYISSTVALAQLSFLRLMLFYLGNGDVDNRVFGPDTLVGRVVTSMNWFFPALSLTALIAGWKARRTVVGWVGIAFTVADAIVFARLWWPLFV